MEGSALEKNNKKNQQKNKNKTPILHFSLGPLGLSIVSVNLRRHHICNVFFHWLEPCSAIDRKRALIMILAASLTIRGFCLYIRAYM